MATEASNIPPKNGETGLKSKLPKIKIFQRSQKYFETLGINPGLMIQLFPFNQKIVFKYLVYGCQLASNVAFALHEVKSFWEYIQSIFLCSISIFAATILSILIFRVDILFQYIASFENIVNTGE